VSELISIDAEEYARLHTTPLQGALGAIADWTREQTQSPGMMSGLAEARLLEALIVVGGARTVLEIGTFTGLGAVTMAAALGPDGRVTTLEVDRDTAAAARGNIEGSGYGERIELIEGDALQTLDRLDGPFDLIYIDAWKNDYPTYYDLALPKLAERGVIVADNLFRGGRVLDPPADDDATRGVREFAQRVHADERVHNVLLTIGDGVMVIWRAPAR
jgi:caffeoyl-CoA O-methyltransferase